MQAALDHLRIEGETIIGKLEILVDMLNAFISGEVNITRDQRENMVRTVAILGGLTERQRLITAEKEDQK